MEYWGLVKYLMLVLLFFLQIHEHNGCFVEERKGLLVIKSFLRSQHVDVDVDHLLPSWTDERESDCCGWERVTCNATTRHVMFLSLNNTKQFSEEDYNGWLFFKDYPIWLLNVSLFRPFEELRSLNLSYNGFNGWTENEGFERLSILRKLESLDLSYNKFNNSILSSLNAVTSLKSLTLSYNKLKGPLRAQDSISFSKLTKLKHLDLSGNRFNSTEILRFLGPLPALKSLRLQGNDMKGHLSKQDSISFSKLTKLKHLDLSWNLFHDTEILRFLGALPALKSLRLGYNAIEGHLSKQDLVTFSNLEILDLSVNNLKGSIQDSISFSKLTKLKHLNLSWNLFHDTEILRFLGALPALKSLRLQGNDMKGHLSKQDLVTFSNLEILDLSRNNLKGSIQDSISFSKLTKLKHLDLSGNRFNSTEILRFLGPLPALKSLRLQGNDMKGHLSKQDLVTFSNLEILDLSGNNLKGSIQDSISLSKLTKLKHLDLSSNMFNNTEILRFLGPLPSLKSLRLMGNGMEGHLSKQDLVTFSNLEILDLGWNFLNGSIPPCIGELSSLKALSLAGNDLSGSLPIQGLCQLNKLEELDLSWNNFEGFLPPCLNNLTSLGVLDLSQNSFTGNISSLISALTSLVVIDLSHNCFSGLFSFSSFANHTKLEMVQIGSGTGEFEVETEISSWVPLFQLKFLVLSNCKLNKLTGEIPKFLLNQAELRVVDLSHNNLKGSFPHWLLQNIPRLEFLSLRNNSFTGQFHLSLYTNIESLDVSNNQIGGQPQENLWEMVPYIKDLNLSGNSFEGSIPAASICGLRGLDTLDLSSNKFSGEVPKQLVAGCIKLSALKLSNNNFHGKIFSEYFNLTELVVLYLDNNQFTGTLSNVISRCSQLYVLDISNNDMSGEIQSGIDKMILSILVMRNNSFKGLFPCELMPDSFLDLSLNSFSGSLSHCPNLEKLNNIHLQGNKFMGSIPKALLNSLNLYTLDIRDNFLSGSIPNFSGGISNLRILMLSGNRLSGLIPHMLCQLREISLMDLSRNSFFGSIPHCFNNITFGKIGAISLFSAWDPLIWSNGKIFYTYGSFQDKYYGMNLLSSRGQNEVEFVTKYRRSAYKGDILNYMSGLDLSCNKLTGEIPHELGNLSSIHALNLSHNQLTGSIPTSFSKLTQIESLDLSFNSLSGKIPSELIDLYFLEVFTVAYNNLSGRLPEMKAQFGTFESSSYEGNPYLCGPPLQKNCTSTVVHSPTISSDESERKWYEIDPIAFSATFAASYIVFLLGVATVLYINPYWRRRWFNLVEECFYSSYYFVCDTLHKLLVCFHNSLQYFSIVMQ